METTTINVMLNVCMYVLSLVYCTIVCRPTYLLLTTSTQSVRSSSSCPKIDSPVDRDTVLKEEWFAEKYFQAATQ